MTSMMMIKAITPPTEAPAMMATLMPSLSPPTSLMVSMGAATTLIVSPVAKESLSLARALVPHLVSRALLTVVASISCGTMIVEVRTTEPSSTAVVTSEASTATSEATKAEMLLRFVSV